MVTKVYMSGPISLDGKATEKEIADFMRQFSVHCANLRNMGFHVINPCELSKQDTWEDYMRLNLPSVCEAHVIATLPQWERSRGSRLEVFLARELGIPVLKVEDFYDDMREANLI